MSIIIPSPALRATSVAPVADVASRVRDPVISACPVVELALFPQETSDCTIPTPPSAAPMRSRGAGSPRWFRSRDYDEVHRYLRRRSKRERLKMGEVAMAAAAAAFDAVRNGTATKEQHENCVIDVALMHASGLRTSRHPAHDPRICRPGHPPLNFIRWPHRRQVAAFVPGSRSEPGGRRLPCSRTLPGSRGSRSGPGGRVPPAPHATS